MRSLGPFVLAIVVMTAFAGAVTRRPERAVAGPTLPAPSSLAASTPAVTGKATFYAEDFDGLPMANGQLFDMNNPAIAASTTWPLGTRLEVYRIPGSAWDETLTPAERAMYFSRRLTVTVTDRGNFTHLVDLSRGAFAQLGRLDEGVIAVAIVPVTD